MQYRTPGCGLEFHVVVGIGDPLRRDYTAIGDTTNLAARLQQLAAPGTILVSEATSRFLQSSVKPEDVGSLHVKGKEAPGPAFKILGSDGPLSEEPTTGGGPRSPFVGRRREMTVLEELRERAEQGEGQVVGIAGEADSRKSRLHYEFRRRPAFYPNGRDMVVSVRRYEKKLRPTSLQGRSSTL